MARSYKRDAKGRFAGGSGSTRKPPGSLPKTTSARGRAKTRETAARAAVKAGGGTRAARSLATAQRARDFYKATGTGTKRSKTKPRSGIRATGRLPRAAARSAIKPTGGLVKRPANKIVASPRKAEPPSIKGKIAKMRRVTSQITDRWARRTARDIADATGKGGKATAARIVLSVAPQKEIKAARSIIARRADRAAAAAARGSKPAARALGIYDRQLAPVLPKGKGKGKNNLQPGPRNTKGAPKKKRRRKPKP
jgi:hypothetical protein